MSGKGGKKGGNQGGNNKKEGGDKNDFKFDFGGNGGKPVLTKEATAALMPVLQQKLGNLVGKSSGYLESLPQSVQKRITALKSIQKKHDDLEAEFKKEREALEKKYDALKNPLYLRRSEIVKGDSEPTEQELVVEKKEGEEEAPKTEAKADNTVVKGIPEFWAGVLKHNEDFNQMIEPEDEPALKHLIDIKCTPISADDTSPSFTLEFYFSPNEYFEETLLKKTYYLNEDPVYGDVMFDHVETTEITWKAGKNLTVKKVTKKDNGGGRGGKGKKGGRAGPPKMIQVEEPCNSFFRFFSLIPEEAEVEDEDELQDLLESDYELGLIVRSQIIPNAVMWFTGEMELGMDGFDEEDDEEGDDEDDEEGGEGEDDDEDDDEEFDPSTAPTTGQGQQPECKQQ